MECVKDIPRGDRDGEEGVRLDNSEGVEEAQHCVDGRIQTRERASGGSVRGEDLGGVGRAPRPAGKQQGVRRRDLSPLSSTSSDRTETGTR